MSGEFVSAGRGFINANASERMRLVLEFSTSPKQVEIADYFTSPGELYSDIQQFRGELAFLVMIGPTLDPRDLVWYVATICERAKCLPEDDIGKTVTELIPFMESEKKGSNLGETSVRELITCHINQSMQRRHGVTH